jgi:hypothetical protein
MEYTYQILESGSLTCLQRLPDGAFIPFDENNGDYVAYLAWVAAGNIAPIIQQ